MSHLEGRRAGNHGINHSHSRNNNSSNTLNRMGSTLVRAGNSARRGLSNFFGINQQSRDIWSEKFKQRVNVSRVMFYLAAIEWHIPSAHKDS